VKWDGQSRRHLPSRPLANESKRCHQNDQQPVACDDQPGRGGEEGRRYRTEEGLTGSARVQAGGKRT
jgi:hypothetical protein